VSPVRTGPSGRRERAARRAAAARDRARRRWAARERLGASDCEAIRPGLIAQPANAASSLAYVVAGGWVIRRTGRRADLDAGFGARAGAALVATGLGSVAYHGPCPPGARWVHDASLAALLVGVVAHDVVELAGHPPARDAALHGAGALVIGGLLAARPEGSNAIAAAVATAGLAGEVALARRGARHRWRLAAALLGLGVAANLATGTGAPGCRPRSILQGHALWHAATAAAFAVWAVDAAGSVSRSAGRPAATPPGRRPG